jgi:hypothetical protein
MRGSRLNSGRRGFLSVLGAIGAASALGWRSTPAQAQAAAAGGKDLPHLSTDDPTGKALHYTEDASKADKSAAPNHKPDDKCSNCQLYMGTAGQSYGPCTLFAGKSVASNGWCLSHVRKPGT